MGSTIVEHEIVTNKTEDADVKKVELITQVLGEKNIDYDGTNLTTLRLAMTDNSGNTVGKCSYCIQNGNI